MFAGGVQPLPSTISLERDEYIAVLENRVRSLESHIKPLIAAHACPFTSLGSSISTEGLNGSRASCSRTHSEFETVGRQIEDLIATETPRIRLSRGVEPLTVSQQTDCIESQRWPHIMSPRSPDSRSSKWKSDMLSALSSVPNGQLVEYLLKYYFDSEEAYRRDMIYLFHADSDRPCLCPLGFVTRGEGIRNHPTARCANVGGSSLARTVNCCTLVSSVTPGSAKIYVG